jgi:hypothetical protein
MAVHLYLSMIPEALIASMLTPEEFGVYYSVGSTKKARSQAIFFEVSPDFRHSFFRIEEGIRRCVPHKDGSPKRSIYISVYRVLEHIPLDVIREFHDLIVKTPTGLLCLPAICFVELRLDGLVEGPERGADCDLPYPNVDHLCQSLTELRTKAVHTKMVNRIQPISFPYRTIKSGIFVGNEEGLLYFPVPSQEELRAKHYRWWRSANM